MRNAKLRDVRGHSIDLARTNDSTTWNGLVRDRGKGRVLLARYPWDLIFKPRAVPAGSRPVRHGRNPGPRLARVGDGWRGWNVNEPMVLREWRKFAAEVARPGGRSGSEGRDADGLGHGGLRRSGPLGPRAQRQPAEAAGWPAPQGEQGRHGRRSPTVRGTSERRCAVSTITKRLTVDQYDQMVENGILPETNRFELIEGRIVEKDVKNPVHSAAAECTRRSIDQALPAGWHTRGEQPVRIPNRRSKPEPDVSVVRGAIRDYTTRHPGPEDVALVVEVTRSSVAKDRRGEPLAGSGPRLWPRRNPPVLDRQRPEAPARGLCPPRTGGPDRGSVPNSQDPGRDGVAGAGHPGAGCRPDRCGGLTPVSGRRCPMDLGSDPVSSF